MNPARAIGAAVAFFTFDNVLVYIAATLSNPPAPLPLCSHAAYGPARSSHTPPSPLCPHTLAGI